MSDRLTTKKRIQEVIAHGFATHRVMNRILVEMANELVDIIYDEKELKVASKTKDTAQSKTI